MEHSCEPLAVVDREVETRVNVSRTARKKKKMAVVER